jgi:hypothetical protein
MLNQNGEKLLKELQENIESNKKFIHLISKKLYLLYKI